MINLIILFHKINDHYPNYQSNFFARLFVTTITSITFHFFILFVIIFVIIINSLTFNISVIVDWLLLDWFNRTTTTRSRMLSLPFGILYIKNNLGNLVWYYRWMIFHIKLVIHLVIPAFIRDWLHFNCSFNVLFVRTPGAFVIGILRLTVFAIVIRVLLVTTLCFASHRSWILIVRHFIAFRWGSSFKKVL